MGRGAGHCSGGAAAAAAAPSTHLHAFIGLVRHVDAREAEAHRRTRPSDAPRNGQLLYDRRKLVHDGLLARDVDDALELDLYADVVESLTRCDGRTNFTGNLFTRRKYVSALL